MLVDIGDDQPSESNWKTLERVLASFAGVARATDVIGWYKSDCVAGVMLTEIGLTNRESIPKTLDCPVQRRFEPEPERSGI